MKTIKISPIYYQIAEKIAKLGVKCAIDISDGFMQEQNHICNDSNDDAMRLAELLKNTHCKLNIIPFNEIGNIYKRPTCNKIESFLNILY